MTKTKSRRGNLRTIRNAPTKIEDNPRAIKHYADLVKAGYEDEDIIPEFVRDKAFGNPHNRKPLRERRYGEGDDMMEDAKEWALRKYLREGEIPPIELRKKSRKSKPKTKKCSCKKK